MYDVPKISARILPTVMMMFLSIRDARATGDAVNGAVIFQQCGACHALEKGKTVVGPSLYGVIGRPAGGIAGFSYSQAMQEAATKGLVWTPENVTAYLQGPRKFLDDFAGDPAARSKMAFSLADPRERDDVVAFLQSQAAN